jgi:hypothetical protein
MSKEFKTIGTEYGDILQAEYTYKGLTFYQRELMTEQEEEIGIILMDLGIDNLRSFADIINLQLGMFVSSALKNKVAPRLLACVLFRADGTPSQESDFRNSLARNFNPFFKEVAADFFTLNEELLNPIVLFVREKVALPFKAFNGILSQLKQYTTLQKGTSRNGVKSEKSHADSV